MTFSLNRVLVACGVALALIVGAVVAPVAAAEIGSEVVTVKGHVVDRSGKPIKGIVVQADCGCDGDLGPFSYVQVKTTATGAYSLRIQKRLAFNIGFNDPKERYLGAGRQAGSTKRTGFGYVINARLLLASVIRGTISMTDGSQPHYVDVNFYNAKTGNGVYANADVAKDGTYVVRVPAGDYKVKFGGASYYVGTRWYGDAATKSLAATVHVGYGKKVAGIDGAVTPLPTISGEILVDGKRGLDGVKEKAVVSLIDASGVTVDSTVTENAFSFVRLHAGEYTITARPTKASHDYFIPSSRSVTIPEGSSVPNAAVRVTSVPASTASKRSVEIELTPSSNKSAESGRVFRSSISVKSYGSVVGGKVKIYVNGKLVAKRTVPASGEITWSKRLGTVVVGSFSIRASFSGTSTTLPRKQEVYALYGA